MPASIPVNVSNFFTHDLLTRVGLSRTNQGKVCDTYDLGNGYLLGVRTNRVSINDFVLPCEIDRKGEILTALTVYWLSVSGVARGIPHHLVTFGKHIDDFLPRGAQRSSQLHRCGMIIKKLEMLRIESVVRDCLTGQAYTDYTAGNPTCGITFPPGLRDGSRFPETQFTPTTKAEVGNDQPMDAAAVDQEHPWLKPLTVEIHGKIAAHAAHNGVILADGKYEFSVDKVLADEVGTPDSSRFWDMEEWQEAVAAGRTPASLDKQFLRNWGKTVATPFEATGINKLKPAKTEHVAFVHSLTVPPDVLVETAKRYHMIFRRLTGQTLDEFQAQYY
jgi:phosphoribosylaminoimidazole-succinocarboxamide synthase